MHRVRIVLLTLALVVSARAGVAQLAKSFEIGFPMVAPKQARVDFLLLGFRVWSVRSLAVGVDCSIATLPVLLTKGVLVLGSGLDLTYPIPLGRAGTLTPRIGGSVLADGGVVADLRGSAGATGYNAGAGLVGRTGSLTRVRLDITHHWFPKNQGAWIVTIGFPMH
jgi:hypothetical protein